MSLTTFTLIGRAILLLISFVGLCAGIRTAFKIDRFIAPFTAACGIITVLMLGGMLRILEPMFWLVYALGFVGVIYAVLTSPRKSGNLCWPLIAALVLFCAFLVWRYYFCHFASNDDISHWGLVARHILRYENFPDRNASYVFFQSYPLGSACFIYYVGKTLITNEGICFVGSNLLLGLLFLPMFSLISPKRKQCYPIAAACFVFLFHYFRNMTLQVDSALAFFGIGTIASIARYRNNLKYALLTAIPGIIAVVYIKNSGMFFSLMSTLCLVWAAKRTGAKKSLLWKIGVFCTVGFIAAYLLWTLHIRLSFPAALETKHAVSLSAYANELALKGSAISLQVFKGLILKLFGFSKDQLLTIAFTIGCAGMVIYGCLIMPAYRQQLKKYWRAFLLCALTYGIWVVMLYAMYLFSMPEEEALMIASFWRYNGCGTTYLMGLTAIIFFVFWGQDEIQPSKLFSIIKGCSVLFLVAVIISYSIPQVRQEISFMKRNTNYSTQRQRLMTLRSEYQLDDDDHFLVFCCPAKSGFGQYANYYYQVKYEFETTNIHMIAEKDKVFLAGTWDEKDYCTDIVPFLNETFDTCDALIIMDKSETFEAQLDSFLETYTGSTPVIYAYEY